MQDYRKYMILQYNTTKMSTVITLKSKVSQKIFKWVEKNNSTKLGSETNFDKSSHFHVWGREFFKVDIWHTFCWNMTNLAALGVGPLHAYFLNLVNFGLVVLWCHAATCISLSLMHTYFQFFYYFFLFLVPCSRLELDASFGGTLA